MMRYMIAMLFIAGTATAANAQQAGLSVPPPTPLSASNNVLNRNGLWLSSDDDTPSLKQQKLRRAIALREYAEQLMADNGGFLTVDQQQEIRRKARAIVTGRWWR